MDEWTLGSEDDYDTIYEQHNPDFIPAERGGPAVVVADSENGRVLEYQREDGDWEQSWTWEDRRLQWPRDADRLPNGNTLVTDSNGNRVIEVALNGSVVWSVDIGFPLRGRTAGDRRRERRRRGAARLDLTSREPSADSGTEQASQSVLDLLPKPVVNGIIYLLPSWVGPLQILAVLGLLVKPVPLWARHEWRQADLQVDVQSPSTSAADDERPPVLRLGRSFPRPQIPSTGGTALARGALLVGLVVAALYLALNEYPAYGAGLYTLTADEIRAAGYGLPRPSPLHRRGRPLRHPPLAFYALAVLRDLGAGALQWRAVRPALFVVLALVPAYLLGRDLLDGRLGGSRGGPRRGEPAGPGVARQRRRAGPARRRSCSRWRARTPPSGSSATGTGVGGSRPPAVRARRVDPPNLRAVRRRDLPRVLGGLRPLGCGLLDGAVVGVGGVVLTARGGSPSLPGSGSTCSPPPRGLTAASAAACSRCCRASRCGRSSSSPRAPSPSSAAGRVLGAWLLAAEFLFKQPASPTPSARSRSSARPSSSPTGVARGCRQSASGDGNWRWSRSSSSRRPASAPSATSSTNGRAIRRRRSSTTRTSRPWSGPARRPRPEPRSSCSATLPSGSRWSPTEPSCWGPGMEWREPATYERHLGAYVNASTCQSAGCGGGGRGASTRSQTTSTSRRATTPSGGRPRELRHAGPVAHPSRAGTSQCSRTRGGRLPGSRRRWRCR